MISLEEMTDADFERFVDHRVEAKAQASANGALSVEDAKAEVRRSLRALLQEGHTTRGNLFRSIRDVATGAAVGHIWLKPDYDDSLATGALHDFTVYEGYRRKQFGRQAMSALNAYARGQGMSSMRVWLAGENDVGQAFCANCGFKHVGSFMRKDIATDRVQCRVILETMHSATLGDFVDHQVQRQAERLVRDLGLSQQAAFLAARTEHDERFPNGATSEGEHVLSIVDAETTTLVGALWCSIHQEGPIQTAFIEDFFIDEPHRGKGLGGQALLALEQYAKQCGAKGICLFVQAHNTGAKRLYLKAGFVIGNTEMEKSLIVGPDTSKALEKMNRSAQQTSAGDVATRAAPEK